MKTINPALGIIGNNALIYVLRFRSKSPIYINEFCDKAQTILYDDIGSTGHFRIAPAKREDLHERFVLCEGRQSPAQFMPRENEELFVSFIVREDLSPLSEELPIIAEELALFCEISGLEVEQMDVREIYRQH